MCLCVIYIYMQISVLLRQGLQRKNGVFVIPVGGPVPIGFEMPGAIRSVLCSSSVVIVLKCQIRYFVKDNVPLACNETLHLFKKIVG